MTKKKSLTIVSVLLLLLTCGMCFIVAGCSSDDIDGSSLTCTTKELTVAQGATINTVLESVTVTFTFGYETTIDGATYNKDTPLTATGYTEMIQKGFMISGFDSSTATGTGENRTLTISYLNKSVKIKYTVTVGSSTEQKPTQNDKNSTKD